MGEIEIPVAIINVVACLAQSMNDTNDSYAHSAVNPLKGRDRDCHRRCGVGVAQTENPFCRRSFQSFKFVGWTCEN